MQISADQRAAKNEVNRKYYARHRERLAKEKRESRKVNLAKEKARKRKYYSLNREAIIEKARLYREKNPEKRRAYELKTRRGRNLKRLYGISDADYNAMLQSQGGCCAICLTPQADMKHRLRVDHDHSNGNVRGLLCLHCNSLLGYSRDDINALKAAISYLERACK